MQKNGSKQDKMLTKVANKTVNSSFPVLVKENLGTLQVWSEFSMDAKKTQSQVLFVESKDSVSAS